MLYRVSQLYERKGKSNWDAWLGIHERHILQVVPKMEKRNKKNCKTLKKIFQKSPSVCNV